MIDLHLKIFKLTIDLHIKCDCKKHKVENAEECVKAEKHEETPINISEYLYDGEVVKDEYIAPTEIELQASRFEQELKHAPILYDIPNAGDVPPRHQIQDDVEIITDSYEKEVEDIIEGRR